jgi:hypothetical protein
MGIALQNSVVETIRLAQGSLERVGISASRYLLERAIEYARDGAEAERSGDAGDAAADCVRAELGRVHLTTDCRDRQTARSIGGEVK